MLLLELMVNYIAQQNLTLSLPVFMAFFSELEVNTPPVASNMSRSRRPRSFQGHKISATACRLSDKGVIIKSGQFLPQAAVFSQQLKLLWSSKFGHLAKRQFSGPAIQIRWGSNNPDTNVGAGCCKTFLCNL
jgi:hypothetical protein